MPKTRAIIQCPKKLYLKGKDRSLKYKVINLLYIRTREPNKELELQIKSSKLEGLMIMYYYYCLISYLSKQGFCDVILKNMNI